jgi:imidazolonepropionase-like amidohydrolase
MAHASRRTVPAALLAALVGLAAASPAAAAPPEALAVTCGRLLDPGRREVRTNATVFLENGAVSSARPAAARAVDLSRYTCLPGLVDAHTHLLLQGDLTAADYDEQVLKESQPYRALRAAAAARVALDHGFTTLRDLGTEGAGFVDVDLKRVFEAGVLDGPRVFTSGPAMSVTGGYPLLGYSWELKMPDGVLKCDGADACRRAVRLQVEKGVDWIKVYADRSYRRQPDGTWTAIANFTPEELAAIVDEAHRLRRKVAAHAITPVGQRAAIAAGADSIEHGDAIDAETIRIMARKRIPYCPTITAGDAVRGPRTRENPVWEELWTAAQATFRAAHAAGVPIAFGTDAGAFDWHARSQADEFGFMVAWGMTPWEAIRSATVVAGDLVGPVAAGRLGCLDAGCTADLVAVEGDPLADVKALREVRAVIVRGKLVKEPGAVR